MSGVKIYEDLRPYVGTSRGLGIPDEDTHQGRLQAAADLLILFRTKHVLDVGCGYGDLRFHVLACDYFGIDVNEWMIEEAHRRLPVTLFRRSSLEEFPPDPLRFDAVAALGLLATVEPARLPRTMELLCKQASRLLCVSFMQPEPDYKGVFHQHELAAVVGDLPILARTDTPGETTLLLDIRR